jgi:hypothetical protein
MEHDSSVLNNAIFLFFAAIDQVWWCYLLIRHITNYSSPDLLGGNLHIEQRYHPTFHRGSKVIWISVDLLEQFGFQSIF